MTKVTEMKQLRLPALIVGILLVFFVSTFAGAKVFLQTELATGQLRTISEKVITLSNGLKFVNKAGYSSKVSNKPVVGDQITIRYYDDPEKNKICIEYKKGLNSLKSLGSPPKQPDRRLDKM